MQNSDFRTRLTSVCGSQTSSVVLSTLNSVLSTRMKRQYGFQPSPVVLCMQTATLAFELLVSIVPCPHLRFLHANQRLLDQNYKSLWVQDLTVTLCMHNCAFWNRITSLYGFQPSSVVLCVENSDFRTKIVCLYGSKTSPVILCMQTSVPSIRITSLYGSKPSSEVFGCKTATLGRDLQVCMGPRPHLWFWAHLTACLAQE